MRWPQGTQKGNQHNNLQFFVNVCMPHATCFMLFCYVLLDWDSSFTSSVRKPASKILGKESVGLNGSWVDSVNTKFENNMDPNDTNPVATASAAAFPCTCCWHVRPVPEATKYTSVVFVYHQIITTVLDPFHACPQNPAQLLQQFIGEKMGGNRKNNEGYKKWKNNQHFCHVAQVAARRMSSLFRPTSLPRSAVKRFS